MSTLCLASLCFSWSDTCFGFQHAWYSMDFLHCRNKVFLFDFISCCLFYVYPTLDVFFVSIFFRTLHTIPFYFHCLCCSALSYLADIWYLQQLHLCVNYMYFQFFFWLNMQGISYPGCNDWWQVLLWLCFRAWLTSSQYVIIVIVHIEQVLCFFYNGDFFDLIY